MTTLPLSLTVQSLANAMLAKAGLRSIFHLMIQITMGTFESALKTATDFVFVFDFSLNLADTTVPSTHPRRDLTVVVEDAGTGAELYRETVTIARPASIQRFGVGLWNTITKPFHVLANCNQQRRVNKAAIIQAKAQAKVAKQNAQIPLMQAKQKAKLAKAQAKAKAKAAKIAAKVKLNTAQKKLPWYQRRHYNNAMLVLLAITILTMIAAFFYRPLSLVWKIALGLLVLMLLVKVVAIAIDYVKKHQAGTTVYTYIGCNLAAAFAAVTVYGAIINNGYITTLGVLAIPSILLGFTLDRKNVLARMLKVVSAIGAVGFIACWLIVVFAKV